jgi:Bacterial lipid A biosynthesis acyltransferase
MCASRLPPVRDRPPEEGRLIQLVFYAYVGLSRLALALPEPVAYGLAHVAGGIAARTSKKRATVARNLSLITGQPETSEKVRRLVVDAYRSYARYWLETFRLVREGKEFFLERFRGKGEENIDAALERGKGVIVVVGHLGNWDAAGAWVGARGNRLVTVAEVLRPRRMFDFFVAHRAALGMTIYPAARVGGGDLRADHAVRRWRAGSGRNPDAGDRPAPRTLHRQAARGMARLPTVLAERCGSTSRRRRPFVDRFDAGDQSLPVVHLRQPLGGFAHRGTTLGVGEHGA